MAVRNSGVLNVDFALKLFKKFYMSQLKPQEAFDNTVYSVQLPYIVSHSL